jgi:hypothetical protein
MQLLAFLCVCGNALAKQPQSAPFHSSNCSPGGTGLNATVQGNSDIG